MKNNIFNKHANVPNSPFDGHFLRLIGHSLVGLGALILLTACKETRVVEVPVAVEVPVEVVVPVEVEVPVEMKRCELGRFQEARSYVVEAWAVPDSELYVGEPLLLQMRVSAPSYMNIFHVSTSCKVTRLLNNHLMEATEIANFPLANSGIQFTVKPPEGDEGFYFVATRKELEFLSSSDVLNQAAGIASLDLSPAQFYGRLTEALGRINPADWSTTTLYTSVVSQ